MRPGERRNILASTPLNDSGFHVCTLCAVSDCRGEFVWRIKRGGENIEKVVFSKELNILYNLFNIFACSLIAFLIICLYIMCLQFVIIIIFFYIILFFIFKYSLITFLCLYIICLHL